jgi:hypothetical protein
MNIHYYENEKALCADVLRWSKGDQQAGVRMTREMQANNMKLEDLVHWAREYSYNAENPLQRVYQSASEATPAEWRNANHALDDDTTAILEERGIEKGTPEYYAAYGEAFEQARALNPSADMTWGAGRKPSPQSDEVLKRNARAMSSHTRRYQELQPIMAISNLVTALPRLPDGSIDFASGVDAVLGFIPADVKRQAAMDELDRRLGERTKDKPSSELNSGTLASVRQSLESELPDLAAAARSGTYNEMALRQLLWQFK